jgi:bloom syndrome protein
MLSSPSDTVIVTKPYSSVDTLRKPFKTPFKVPFKQPPQETRVIESSDAQQTIQKGEEQNHDNDEIEFGVDTVNSAWQTPREELLPDDVPEEEPTDFGRGGDVCYDDGMSKREW